jgi:hypothetical protein
MFWLAHWQWRCCLFVNTSAVWWATIIYKIVEVGCPKSVTLSIVLGTYEKGSGFPLGNNSWTGIVHHGKGIPTEERKLKFFLTLDLCTSSDNSRSPGASRLAGNVLDFRDLNLLSKTSMSQYRRVTANGGWPCYSTLGWQRKASHQRRGSRSSF